MFSVIIPVHNKLPHLDRSVYSVLNQSFKDFELILIDDASTDGSEQRINEYKDTRIRVFKRSIPGPGGYAARNLGIKEAKYDWIAFLDADDIWHKDYLLNIAQTKTEYPGADIITTNWEMRQEQEQYNSKELSIDTVATRFFLLKDYLNSPKLVWTGAICIRKDLTVRSKGFPEGACKRGGDVDTWVRWLNESQQNIYIENVLAYYYQGTANQVTGKPNRRFCAYNTLKDIYLTTKDANLKKAIATFSNKFIYNMLARQIKAGWGIDHTELRKMYLSPYAVTRSVKLYLMNFKISYTK